MEKKKKIGEFIANASEKAKESFDNIVMKLDQTDDGKFDKEDVAVIVANVNDSLKKNAQELKESGVEKAKQIELKLLQPIFKGTLSENNFSMPKFIRITDREKKYIESEVCQGSIGYHSDPKGVRMVNIFRDSIDRFGLMFYPDTEAEFYYVDPSDRDMYIALDMYFGYLSIISRYLDFLFRYLDMCSSI